MDKETKFFMDATAGEYKITNAVVKLLDDTAHLSIETKKGCYSSISIYSIIALAREAVLAPVPELTEAQKSNIEIGADLGGLNLHQQMRRLGNIPTPPLAERITRFVESDPEERDIAKALHLLREVAAENAAAQGN